MIITLFQKIIYKKIIKKNVILLFHFKQMIIININFKNLFNKIKTFLKNDL